MKAEAVTVKMLLMNTAAAKALDPVSCKQGCVDTGNGDEEPTFDEESLFSSVDIADSVQLCSSDDTGTCELGYLRNSVLTVDKSELQSSNTFSAQSSCAYLTPPPSQETRENEMQNSGRNIQQHSTRRVSSEELMASLEAGLRHVMCEPLSRNSKGNKITSNEDFDCLPIIAPALWLPDYHRSLSEQAVFLPTISHAIANVSGHSSARFGLKVKAWQLSQRHPHKGGNVFSARAIVDKNEVQEALSVDLWATMASGLNHMRTAKQSHLRDIFESADGACAVGETEYMLDEIATDCGSDGTCDEESEFEDLLDPASNSDDGSMCNLSVSDIGDTCHPTWTEACCEAPDRLPNRWNSEHPSRPDPECNLFEDSTELHETEPCSDLGFGAGEGERWFGSHRENGQCWGGSDSVHDSMVLQYPELKLSLIHI